MNSIRPITSISQNELETIIPGYSSSSVFEVQTVTGENGTTFSLTLKKLDRPFVKAHDYSDPATLAHYNEVANQGASFGAFVDEKLVGFILGEVQSWNSTLVIREFGVLPASRRHGIGRSLLEKGLAHAKQEGLRGVLCETQTTNVPAIRLYQKFGFAIQGLDLSLYSNHDLEKGEVAIFLRKAID
jgi:ribosomal protein S18 acetylase RimI-like enzyme